MKNKKHWLWPRLLGILLLAITAYLALTYGVKAGVLLIALSFISFILITIAGERDNSGNAVDLENLLPGSTLKLDSYMSNPDRAIFITEDEKPLFVDGLIHKQNRRLLSDPGLPPHMPHNSTRGTEFIVVRGEDGITALSLKK